MWGQVYFLGCDEIDRVKIGYSCHPESRRANYFAWCPYPIEVLATTDGGRREESQFQWFFVDDWAHSEWFMRTERMNEIIEKINGGASASELVGHIEPRPFSPIYTKMEVA